MDKKDVIAFFQELRLFLGNGSNGSNVSTNSANATNGQNSNAIYEHLDDLFQSTDINRLDIKRMYRFLDKNSETFDFIGGKKSTACSPHDLEEEYNEGCECGGDEEG